MEFFILVPVIIGVVAWAIYICKKADTDFYEMSDWHDDHLP